MPQTSVSLEERISFTLHHTNDTKSRDFLKLCLGNKVGMHAIIQSLFGRLACMQSFSHYLEGWLYFEF